MHHARPLRAVFLALIAILQLSGASAVADEVKAAPPPVAFVTKHTVTIGGSKISFTAIAGETHLYSDGGDVSGSIFSYSYFKEPRRADRPVLFIVGGGPGSASHFLNVGFAGPWSLPAGRLALAGGKAPSTTPPFDVVDNPDSLLDVADLVFIDPIGTGYSRAIGAGKSEDFWGVDEDLESLAQFIQLWLSKHGRWNSPKFFMGESYGGTRAAMIPAILMGGPTFPGYLRAITLNGVIVLVNGLGLPVGAPGLDPVMSAASVLPNMAATAWYHGKIDRRGRSLKTFYDEATQFAFSAYADALKKEAAKTLAGSERESIVRKLQEFTGLSSATFDASLMIDPARFANTLLADRGLAIGVYDSRYSFPLGKGGVDPVADDAALARSMPVLTGAFLDMEHDKLKVTMDRPFAPIRWRQLLPKWKFERPKVWTESMPSHQWQTNAETLAAAMRRNDKLHALVATGYYDLLAPPAQAKYTTESAGVPADRLTLLPFEAGHEPYMDQASSELAKATRELILRASD